MAGNINPTSWIRVPNGGTPELPSVYTAIREALQESADAAKNLQSQINGLKPSTSTSTTTTIISGDGGGGGSGGGSVTSVGLDLSTEAAAVFGVTGSPVLTAGTITLGLDTQTANTVFAGPTTGMADEPTFRALVATDIPDISATYLTVATAASTYLTQSAAASTYLTQSAAASTYLTQANAASTYLTQANAATTYLALSGGTLTGRLNLPASVATTNGAKFNLGSGATPTSFADGDVWVTATGINVRVAGSSLRLFPYEGGQFDGTVTTKAGTTSAAGLILASGTNLTTPAAGAVEFDGSNLYFTPSSTRKTVAFTDSNITGTAANVTGVVALTNGGTGKSLTAADGGIVYSDADSMEILAPTATAGQVLRSGASAAPSWSTATYPATTAINQILYSSAANTIAGLATANNSVLVTSGTGVPSLAADIPTGVTIGTKYIYRVDGTDVAIADGGTGASTAVAAFNALSPLTTLGDTLYNDGTNDVRLAGNTTTTRKFLRQVGTGSASAAPVWDTLTAGDIPSLSGTYLPLAGGTMSGAIDMNSQGITNAGLSTFKGIRSYSSSGGGSGTNGRYAPVVIVSITGNFANVGLTLAVSDGSSSGDSTALAAALVRLRVKQQNVMGGAPYVDVDVVAGASDDWDTDSFIFITTTNTVSLTEGTLYIEQPYQFTNITASVIDYAVSANASYTLCTASTTPTNTLVAPASLPAGTQTKPVAMMLGGASILRFLTGSAERMRVTSAGNVGIGTAPSYRFHVDQTYTSTAGNITTRFGSSVSPAATNANTQYGLFNTLTMNANATGGGRALYSIVQHRGASNTGVLSAGLFGIDNNDATTMGSTISDAVAIYALTPAQNAMGGTITNSYGLYIQAQSGTNITNSYGVYQTGTSDINYFAGRVGIGTTSPGTLLHLGAGTATVAPFRLTSGINLTTAAAGSMEFDGSNLYFTPATTRKTVAFTDSNITGTAANVTGTVATGNGGTGLTSIGSSNQVLGVDSGATALEYKTVTAGTGISISHTAGAITITNTSPSSGGTVTSVTASSPLASSGGTAPDISLGTVGVANGGTGQTSFLAGQILYASATTTIAGLSVTAGGMLYGGATAPAYTATADLTWDNTNKRLGISQSSPSYKLAVTDNNAALTGSNRVVSLTSTISNAASNSNTQYGLYNFLSVGNNITGTPHGIYSIIDKSAGANTANLNAISGQATMGVAGITVTAAAALRAVSPAVTLGTFTNAYGLYIETQDTANVGTGYGIYQASTADRNILAGNVRIGSTSVATNALDVTGAATVSGNFVVDSTTLYVDATNNQVGIGIVPSFPFHFDVSSTDTAANAFKLRSNWTLAPASASAVSQYMSYQTATTTGANFTGNLIGHNVEVSHNGSSNVSAYIALLGKVDLENTGNMTAAYAFYADSPGRTSTGTISTAVGLYVASQTVTGVTTPLGIYQVGTSDKNILAGGTRIGSTSAPTNALDVTGAVTISGNLTVDSPTFFVDSSNNRIGVGTLSPSVLADFVQSLAGDAQIRLNNSNSATNARMTYLLANGSVNAGFELTGASFTTYPSRAKVYNGGAGGLVMESDNAAGFFSVSTAAVYPTGERLRINSSGVVIIGGGESGTTPTGNTLRAPSGTGTNITGGTLTITAGNGTGLGGSGSIIMRTAPVGVTGSTANTMVDRVTVTRAGSVVIGDAALATNATDGFLYIPSMSGTPTAAPPTAHTGRVPIVFDTSSSKLWVYNTAIAAWRQIALTV